MTILITGATSQLGMACARTLAAAEGGFRTASRRPGDADVVLDFEHPEAWEVALKGIDKMLLVVPEALPRGGIPAAAFTRQALAKGVSRVVLVSAMNVEVGAEATGMLTTEEVVSKASVFSILRPHTFMQVLLRPPLVGGIQSGLLQTPLGSAKVSWVDARDVGEAAAACLVMEDPPSEVLLTGPEALSMDDVARILAPHLRPDLCHETIAPETFRRCLGDLGMPPPVTSLLAQFFGALASGKHAPVHPGVESLLGRPPRSLGDVAKEWGSR